MLRFEEEGSACTLNWQALVYVSAMKDDKPRLYVCTARLPLPASFQHASLATATRDLSDLIKKGVLIRTG